MWVDLKWIRQLYISYIYQSVNTKCLSKIIKTFQRKFYFWLENTATVCNLGKMIHSHLNQKLFGCVARFSQPIAWRFSLRLGVSLYRFQQTRNPRNRLADSRVPTSTRIACALTKTTSEPKLAENTHNTHTNHTQQQQKTDYILIANGRKTI